MLVAVYMQWHAVLGACATKSLRLSMTLVARNRLERYRMWKLPLLINGKMVEAVVSGRKDPCGVLVAHFGGAPFHLFLTVLHTSVWPVVAIFQTS